MSKQLMAKIILNLCNILKIFREVVGFHGSPSDMDLTIIVCTIIDQVY